VKGRKINKNSFSWHGLRVFHRNFIKVVAEIFLARILQAFLTMPIIRLQFIRGFKVERTGIRRCGSLIRSFKLLFHKP
jgi:hypothetical protein